MGFEYNDKLGTLSLGSECKEKELFKMTIGSWDLHIPIWELHKSILNVHCHGNDHLHIVCTANNKQRCVAMCANCSWLSPLIKAKKLLILISEEEEAACSSSSLELACLLEWHMPIHYCGNKEWRGWGGGIASAGLLWLCQLLRSRRQEWKCSARVKASHTV